MNSVNNQAAREVPREPTSSESLTDKMQETLSCVENLNTRLDALVSKLGVGIAKAAAPPTAISSIQPVVHGVIHKLADMNGKIYSQIVEAHELVNRIEQEI